VQSRGVPRFKIAAAGQLVDTLIHPPSEQDAPARRRKAFARPRLLRPTSARRSAASGTSLTPLIASCALPAHSPPQTRPHPSPGIDHPPRRPARWLHLAAPRIIKRSPYIATVFAISATRPGQAFLPVRVRDRLHREPKLLSLLHRVATTDNAAPAKHTACSADHHHGRPAAHRQHGRAHWSQS